MLLKRKDKRNKNRIFLLNSLETNRKREGTLNEICKFLDEEEFVLSLFCSLTKTLDETFISDMFARFVRRTWQSAFYFLHLTYRVKLTCAFGPSELCALKPPRALARQFRAVSCTRYYLLWKKFPLD